MLPSVTIEFVPEIKPHVDDPQTPLFSFSGEMALPQQHLQAAAASGSSMSFVPHQHQQAASISQSVSMVPQQHPQAAAVSDEMSLFNTLDSDAKISRMYEFMFRHMRGLETRLNEVAKNTSERFSKVDARLQALEQRAGEQNCCIELANSRSVVV